MKKNYVWDVIIIGGGPAGMCAAGQASALGSKVLLIEKNNNLGKKLLITGGGRCNLTNSEFDTRKFLQKLNDDGKYLFSTFSQHEVKDTLDFFHKMGMKTKVENDLRTFPVSDSAKSVLDVLLNYMKKNNVEIISDSPVVELVKNENKIIGVRLKNKEIIKSKKIIIATGGTSHPETGSTGDGFKWLEKIGHTIIKPTPSLVPIITKDKWVQSLAGTSLNDIKITVFKDNKKEFSKKGKILFTHVGLSGPTILNMSKKIGELLKEGDVSIGLDILPKEDYGTLNTKFQILFKDNDKKKIKNTLSDLILPRISTIVLEQSKIDPNKECNSITREERIKLINLIKNIPMKVNGLLGPDKAIITSGGVKLDEVNFKTMQSRLYSNLYLIGDVLNIDRPSGGYSLQICWSTGFVAGMHAGKK
jgi:predicted Rossmann fold flavoprotein